MVIVRIKGGLGNQMFQYAMARKVQIESGIGQIGFDLSIVNKDKQRNYSLGNFGLCDNIEIVKEKARRARLQETLAFKLVSYFIAGRREPVAEKRENLLAPLFACFGIVQEDHSSAKIYPVLYRHRFIYLNGWFQTARIPQSIRNVLLRDFKWRDEARLQQSSIYRKIIETNAVCVHIRRGDYIGNPRFDVCNADYYYRAIDYIVSMLESPFFFVFSDDIEDVKENMHFRAPIMFSSEFKEDYEDLYLMKNCKHFIMSNSTYSWWAQFLSDASDKIVVAPRKWCLDDAECAGIYMDNWVLLDV